MKRLGRIIPVMLVLCMLLAGCGASFDADESTVYVEKNGKIYSVDVEAVDRGYYDQDELEAFIQEEVKAYNDANGKDSVKAADISVENGVGKLKMQYADAEDYTSFNGIELYHGSIVKAIAAGYDFDTAFFKVEDGQITGTAAKQEIFNDEELKVVVIRANINVKVEGKIAYVSGENVMVTGNDTVSIRKEWETENTSFETKVYTYIVYK